MKKLFSLLIVFSLISYGVLFANPFSEENAVQPVQITTINNISYESSLASFAQQPKDCLKISFGSKDEEVGGVDQDPDHYTGGLPYSFLPQSDGSVWILDSVNSCLKHFNSAGKFISKISLPTSTANKKVLYKDFSSAPDGGFYLYSGLDGSVLHIASDGKILSVTKGLDGTLRLGTTPQGNLLVENPNQTGVIKLNPQGKVIGKFPNEYNLSTYCDSNGNPYGIKGDNDQSTVLYKVNSSAPTKENILASFTIDVFPGQTVHYVSRKVIGTDSQGNVYLELVACDNSGNLYVNRDYKISPTGEVLSTLDFIYPPSVDSPDVPKHSMVTPDGKIMTITADTKSYGFVTYTFP
ncbi:MAG: hypothetical protein HQM08_22245 [Candidatus Riflebacteria bacterium]|nr:hypothetical protein [Candidatus Riflebacteria bacterium]